MDRVSIWEAPPARGGAARIARIWLVVLLVCSGLAVWLGDSFGAVLVGFPAAVIASLIGLCLFIMRRNRVAGAVGLALLLLTIAAFFAYADAAYAMAHRPAELYSDYGSALHNHFMPHGAAVIAGAHTLAAGLVLRFR